MQLPIILANHFAFKSEESLGLVSFSLGNLGYSGTYCASSSTVINKLTFACYGGALLESVEEAGVNPPDVDRNLCSKTSENEACSGNIGGIQAQFSF